MPRSCAFTRPWTNRIPRLDRHILRFADLSHGNRRTSRRPLLASAREVRAEGDIIEVRTFSGQVRRVLVQERSDDIKDSKPGWDGIVVSSSTRGDEPGDAVWGYDDAVLRRVGKAPAGLEKKLEQRAPAESPVPNMYDEDLERSLAKHRR